MKNVFYFWICMAVWLLSACSSQKKGDGEDVQVLMKDSVDANGLQRMQVSDSKMSFTYNGKEYHSHVVRRPDDSLPVVTNEQGEKFVDNRIPLRNVLSKGKCGLFPANPVRLLQSGFSYRQRKLINWETFWNILSNTVRLVHFFQ